MSVDGLDALTSDPSVSMEPRDVCPVVRPRPDFNVFMASRNADLRRILRRAGRRLEARDAKYEVEVATTPDAVARVLPDVVSITNAAEAVKPSASICWLTQWDASSVAVACPHRSDR